MKQLFIIDDEYTANSYGVGTYIEKLTKAVHSKYEIIIVHLYSYKYQELTMKKCRRIYHVFIPAPDLEVSTPDRYNYCQAFSAVCLLLTNVRVLPCSIFHFNFPNVLFKRALKELVPQARIIFTKHVLFNVTRELLDISTVESPKKVLNQKKELEAMSLCNTVICVTKEAQKQLIEDFGVSVRVSHIYNGLYNWQRKQLSKEERIRIKRRLGFNDDEKVVLFVGRLEEEKGIVPLIKAFRTCLSKELRLRLVIVGDGEFGNLIELASDCFSKVHFTGFLIKRKIALLYQIADIGVMPSINEQCSYVALEMVSYKVPLIVSSYQGLDEIFENEVTAAKIRPSISVDGSRNIDVGDLASRIEVTLSETRRTDEMAERARAVLSRHFNYKNFKDQMLTIYSEL